MIKNFLSAAVCLLLFLCLLLSSSEATLTKPNVPQFTINLYDSSYDIAPTSTTNPFNGQTTGTPGRHIESRTIEIRIKNPYPPSNSGVYPTDFHYDIRYRGHFGGEQDWWNVFETRYGYLQPVSSSEETIYKIDAYKDSTYIDIAQWSRGIPEGSTIDFQLSAFTGGYSGTPINGWTFHGENSGWSSTQSITLDFNTPASKYVPSPKQSYGTTTYAAPEPSSTGPVTPRPITTNAPTASPTPLWTQPSQTAAAPAEQTNESASPSAFTLLVIAAVAVLAVVIALTVAIIIRRHNS